ncbi:MAG: DUF308 domain-containing protein [Clostridia bacterium]|nr:DUF308 domain-containing protein [Clostridia bacterium]
MAKKKLNDQAIINAIALIVLGILFCIFRAGMINVLLTIVGVVLIGLGIYDIVKKNYIPAVIEIILGIAVIVCGWTILDIALLVLGIGLVIYSVYQIVMIAKDFKKKGWMALIKPIITLIIGIFLIVAKWLLVDWVFIVIGVIFIINGIMALLQK